MIETYLSTRETLLGVVLLMDLRRIPKLEELNFINWLNHYDIPAILVLTKADKLSKTKQIKQILAISKTLSIKSDDLVLFSAKTSLGNERLRNKIENLLSP